tara:strand:- start:190 stop:477 length:288 start_codon:yes stop_codon:yes gene_type:complete
VGEIHLLGATTPQHSWKAPVNPASVSKSKSYKSAKWGHSSELAKAKILEWLHQAVSGESEESTTESAYLVMKAGMMSVLITNKPQLHENAEAESE